MAGKPESVKPDTSAAISETVQRFEKKTIANKF